MHDRRLRGVCASGAVRVGWPAPTDTEIYEERPCDCERALAARPPAPGSAHSVPSKYVAMGLFSLATNR